MLSQAFMGKIKTFSRMILIYACLMLMLFLSSNPILASWSNDPNGNTPVCLNEAIQHDPQAVSGGDGILIVVWQDQRNGTEDIYAQKLDANGNPLWAENGVAAIIMDGDQFNVSAVSDGNDGIIIVWCDRRSGFLGDVYGQRIDKDGILLWGEEGKPVGKAPLFQGKPQISASGEEDFVVAWEDHRNQMDIAEIYCQKIDLNGNTIWEEDVKVAPVDTLPSAPKILGDGNGGAYIAWYEERPQTPPSQLYKGTGVYVTRRNSDGTAAWEPEFLNVIEYAEGEPQLSNLLLSPGYQNDIYMTWIEHLATDVSIVTRINSDGVTLGKKTIQSYEDILTHCLCPTNMNNCYYLYTNANDFEDIALLKLDQNCVLLWSQIIASTFNGLSVIPYAKDLVLMSDESVVTIYRTLALQAQRYDNAGSRLWDEGGIRFAENANGVTEKTAVSDGNTIVLTAFERNDDIFAQRIFPNGTLPVELSHFSAKSDHSRILLSWNTESETNNYGFEIQRRLLVQNTDWVTIAFVPGHGSSSLLHQYNYVDEDLSEDGNYSYRLKQIDTDGVFAYSHEITVQIKKSLSFKLTQNYPNPFNSSTFIHYTLSEACFVCLKVYNLLGEEIEILVNENQIAGEYKQKWTIDNVPTGIYVYRLQAGKFESTKKMIFLR